MAFSTLGGVTAIIVLYRALFSVREPEARGAGRSVGRTRYARFSAFRGLAQIPRQTQAGDGYREYHDRGWFRHGRHHRLDPA